MSDNKSAAPKQVATPVNVYLNAKQSLILKPKTSTDQAFIYHSIADLENLIGFVGTSPKVSVDKGKMILTFGKSLIPDNSVIMRNAYGEVTRVLTFDQANEQFDIAAQSDFKPEHRNTLAVKPKGTRTRTKKE